MTTGGHVAFFGHNSADAAVRRRAIAFQRAGLRVTGFMPRRGATGETPFPLVDLGETRDNAYGHRLLSILTGACRAVAHATELRQATLIHARNLDMLAMALLLRRWLGLRQPVIYECLDVHHRLSGDGASARLLRWLERRLLAATALVVVSSPRFEAEHFRRHHPGCYRHFLVENRLVEGDAFAARPDAPRPLHPGRLTIGWFGNLRCRRSLDLLKALALAFPDRVEVVLRGYPALYVFPDLAAEIAGIANLRYLGRYRAPEDLATIYAGVDVVWAGDWYEDGANSLWLLPNRIYEGGYFATPALVPAGTETAAWLDRHGAGIVLQGAAETALPARIGQLLDDLAPLLACQEALLRLPRQTFVEPPELMRQLVAMAGAASLLIRPDQPPDLPVEGGHDLRNRKQEAR